MKQTINIEGFIKNIETEIFFGERRILPSTEFKKELDWDSMNAFLFMAMIENQYSVILSDEDFRQSATIKDIFDLVSYRVNGKK